MHATTTLDIFITGATGYVGSAIAQRLLREGHRVRALVRSPARAAALPPGCEPVTGDIGAPARWLAIAGDADVAIHAAYQYDGGVEHHAPDLAATRALVGCAETGAGRLRRVVYTSNAYLLGDHPHRPVNEDASVAGTPDERTARMQLEQWVAGSAHTAIVRLGMVYGSAFGPMGGTLPLIFGAIAGGASLDRIEALTTRWSLIHAQDVAALYARIVDAADRGRGIFHATDGTPLPAARVIALARAALPRATPDAAAPRAAGMPTPFASGHLGRLARDVAVVPSRALALGWAPRVTSFETGAPIAAAEWKRSPEVA